MLMNLCYEHRLNAQLEGIAHCLRTSLINATGNPWQYTDKVFMAEDSSSSNHGFLARSEQCLTLSLNNGRWLKIAPLAPGGLICEDLLIQSDCKSFSTLQSFITVNGFAAQPACSMTSAQFHSRFTPDSQGHALQADRSKYRLLVMMPDATECKRDMSLIRKISALLATLISTPAQSSIECVYKDAFGATKCRELLADLKVRMPGLTRLGITALNPDRKTMLAALMGNASLALCANAGSLADAFQFGLPVAIWNRASAQNTDTINQYAMEWFRHGCQSGKSRIVVQQQTCWLHAQTSNRSVVAVSNKSSQLRTTIEKWIIDNNSGPDHEVTLQGPKPGGSWIDRPVPVLDLVLPSAFSPMATPSGLQQLRASLGRKHRKLIKFRQSPTRFIEDSEVRWLRAFKHPHS